MNLLIQRSDNVRSVDSHEPATISGSALFSAVPRTRRTTLLTLIVGLCCLGISCGARQLVWDVNNPESRDHSNVYMRDRFDRHAEWEFFTSTKAGSCEMPVDASEKYFTVTNVGLNGEEVPWINANAHGANVPDQKIQTPKTR